MSNKKIAILFSALIILGISGIIIAKQVSNKPEVIQMPAPAITKTVSSEPTFVRFEALTQNGITQFQLNGIKYALSNYCKTNGLKAQIISLDTHSLKFPYRDPNNTSGIESLSFGVGLSNNTLLDAKLEYSGTSAIRLYLYTHTTQNMVYDSQNVDLRN